jgi:hypothetical protein
MLPLMKLPLSLACEEAGLIGCDELDSLKLILLAGKVVRIDKLILFLINILYSQLKILNQ